MTKQAISVTLRPENLLWLRGQTHAASRRRVSETLDDLISKARAGAGGRSGAARSVVGTIRIRASDPGLTQADAAVRTLFVAPATPPGTRIPSRQARRLPPRRARRDSRD
jgi:hypothetical protein